MPSNYQANKRLLVKLLGSVSLPADLTKSERRLQLKKGILPKIYNCHHQIPLHLGGKSSIKNLAIMEVKNHEAFHQRFDSYLDELKPKPTDRPYLRYLLEPYEALTLDDTRRPE